jgi:hypothetical protein
MLNEVVRVRFLISPASPVVLFAAPPREAQSLVETGPSLNYSSSSGAVGTKYLWRDRLSENITQNRILGEKFRIEEKLCLKPEGIPVNFDFLLLQTT